MEKFDKFRPTLCFCVAFFVVFTAVKGYLGSRAKLATTTPANTTTIVIGKQAAVTPGDTLVLKVNAPYVKVIQ